MRSPSRHAHFNLIGASSSPTAVPSRRALGDKQLDLPCWRWFRSSPRRARNGAFRVQRIGYRRALAERGAIASCPWMPGAGHRASTPYRARPARQRLTINSTRRWKHRRSRGARGSTGNVHDAFDRPRNPAEPLRMIGAGTLSQRLVEPAELQPSDRVGQRHRSEGPQLGRCRPPRCRSQSARKRASPARTPPPVAPLATVPAVDRRALTEPPNCIS